MSGERSNPESAPSSQEEIRSPAPPSDGNQPSPFEIATAAARAEAAKASEDPSAPVVEDLAADATPDLTPEEMIAPKPAAIPMPEATLEPPATKKGGSRGFMGGVLGGVIAAGLGFGLAHYVPSGWPLALQSPAANEQLRLLEAQLAEQHRTIEALKTAAAPVDSTLTARLEALEGKISAPQGGEDLGPLRAEIEALKAAISSGQGAGSQADLSPLRAEIETMKAEIAQMPRTTAADLDALRQAAAEERAATEARAEAIRAEAESTAKAAVVRGAILRIQAALETGDPFDAALADLSSASLPVPEALTSQSAGVASLSALQASFPHAAREALALANKPAEGAGLTERFTAFLSAQTNMRSLTPQEGDGADAVLSRAEARLADGDLAATLQELAALPPEAAQPFSDWRSRAQARLDAIEALARLSPTLATP